jgi:NADPH-dependent ferric siderophore reductase
MNFMTRTPLRVRHETRLRLVQVAQVETLSPQVRRITLAGDALEGFASGAPDDHVKLFFPPPGQEKPNLPTLGAGGATYPDGAIRPAVRDYTPRRFDALKRQLVIEFVLHGAGPASDWAAQAVEGQWIGVGGPRGSVILPTDYDAYLLAGDETALPAIARFLEEMSAGVRAWVFIEAADAREERHLPTAANASVTWLYRNGGPAGQPALLNQALQDLELPAGAAHAWIAAEIETARTLRRYLMEEDGLPRNQIRASGYWRHGEAGGHATLDD